MLGASSGYIGSKVGRVDKLTYVTSGEMPATFAHCVHEWHEVRRDAGLVAYLIRKLNFSTFIVVEPAIGIHAHKGGNVEVTMIADS